MDLKLSKLEKYVQNRTNASEFMTSPHFPALLLIPRKTHKSANFPKSPTLLERSPTKRDNSLAFSSFLIIRHGPFNDSNFDAIVNMKSPGGRSADFPGKLRPLLRPLVPCRKSTSTRFVERIGWRLQFNRKDTGTGGRTVEETSWTS